MFYDGLPLEKLTEFRKLFDQFKNYHNGSKQDVLDFESVKTAFVNGEVEVDITKAEFEAFFKTFKDFKHITYEQFSELIALQED